MNRHTFGPHGPNSRGAGHPLLFSFRPAQEYGDAFAPFPDGGGYPIGFLKKAYRTLHVTDPSRVLHVCAGSVQSGVRVDVRAQLQPTVVADGRALPFRAAAFPAVLIDPPYTEAYARDLYGTDYPAPRALLIEALRVVQFGGRVGMLHFQVPMGVAGLRMIGVWGITTGAGYAIRAWSVFERTPTTAPLDLAP